MKSSKKQFDVLVYIRLIALLVPGGLISCAENCVSSGDPVNPVTNITRVSLIDSLGTITLSLPIRYDTSFSWTHYSDCGKPCDERKYRFQPKSLPLIKETGWFWIERKDSVDRLTISHTRDSPFHDGDTAKNVRRHNQLKNIVIQDPQNPPLIFDTLEKIRDRYFSLFEFQKLDSIQAKTVVAITTIKNNLITFKFELMTKSNDTLSNQFFKSCHGFIQTIQMSKGF